MLQMLLVSVSDPDRPGRLILFVMLRVFRGRITQDTSGMWKKVCIDQVFSCVTFWWQITFRRNMVSKRHECGCRLTRMTQAAHTLAVTKPRLYIALATGRAAGRSGIDSRHRKTFFFQTGHTHCVLSVRIQYNFYCVRILETKQGYNTLFIYYGFSKVKVKRW